MHEESIQMVCWTFDGLMQSTLVHESTMILTFVLTSLLEGSLVPTWKIIANSRPAPVKIRVII